MTAMNPVFAASGLILVATITPRPNNLLVLKHAGECGLRILLGGDRRNHQVLVHR